MFSKISFFTVLALQSLVQADPSDQSGGAQIALSCNGVDIPDPVGGSGTSYFSSNLQFFPANGQAGGTVTCTQENPTCANCLVSYDGLSSATNVTACWNPPAGKSGCGINFDYNGYHFDSQAGEPYCGHTNSFAPFSSDLTALCYFNLTGTAGQ